MSDHRERAEDLLGEARSLGRRGAAGGLTLAMCAIGEAMLALIESLEESRLDANRRVSQLTYTGLDRDTDAGA